MDNTVGFVSENLVTQANFVEFRDSWNFTFFEANGFWVTHAMMTHGMVHVS